MTMLARLSRFGFAGAAAIVASSAFLFYLPGGGWGGPRFLDQNGPRLRWNLLG